MFADYGHGLHTRLEIGIAELSRTSDQRIISTLYDSGSTNIARLAAVCLIRRLSVTHNVKLTALLAASEDSDDHVATWALRELGEVASLEDRHIVEYLRHLVAHSRNKDRIRGAAMSLAQLGDNWIVPHAQVWVRASDSLSIVTGVLTLAKIGTREALDIVESAAERLRGTSIEWGVLAQLGRHGIASVEPRLHDCLEHSDDPTCKLTVAAALANFDSQSALTAIMELITKWDEEKQFVILHILHEFADFAPKPGEPVVEQVTEWIETKRKRMTE